MRKKINKTLALLMTFALCFSSVNIQAFAQIINDTEQAVINTTEETTVEETAEGEVLTESITEQELSTQTQETTENEQTMDVEGVSTEVEETVSEEESVIESQTQTEEATTVEEVITEAETEETAVTESETNNWDGVTTENIYEADNYKVTFILASYWDTGFNANIKIENTGDTVIQNWYLNLDFDSEITNIWNAEISEESKENSYTIKNAGWNQDIAVGCAVEFGISGNETFKGFPESYKLTGTGIEIKAEDYNITYSIESDWGSGFTGSIAITNNTDTTLEDWVLEFDFDREITELWDGVIDSHDENHYVIRNAVYNSSIATGATVSIGFKGGAAGEMTEPENYKLYSYKAGDAEEETETKEELETEEETDKTTDTDNDEVPDYIEDIFGLDKTKEDTDNDKLPDFFELRLVVLDPLKPDTDGNGINDGDEDADTDGLTNLEEFYAETNPLYADTDKDGLTDGEEVHKYKTSPVKEDTDGDGALDGKEIELGTNPLAADETFDISMESDSEDTVKASVSIELSGEQIDTLSVEEFENDFLFPENMPGYIGSAYDFTVEGSFEDAIISFEFNESLLSTPDFEPVIYYFNEEEQVLEELETTVTGNVASARVTHFSKYILLNKGETDAAYAWHDVWGSEDTTKPGVELVFVIHDPDSEYYANFVYPDRITPKVTAIHNFSNSLPQNSKTGVVWYSQSWLRTYSENAYDKVMSEYVIGFDGTQMYGAINKSFSQFGAKDNDTLKMIVLISEGETDDKNLHSSVIARAKDYNIRIYTIGLGGHTDFFDNYLKPLAEDTSGKFYHASDESQLGEIYENIRESMGGDIKTDSDGDGIPDYYEDNLPMFNGLTLHLDKNDIDSDDDGLEDGEEVKLIYEYNEDKTQVKVTGKFLSNPNAEDTDKDGLNDRDELYYYDTYVLFADSDRDGLNDGIEIENWFDPRSKDYDKDGRLDLEEYEEGTSPYIYNVDFGEFIWDFGWGVFLGDIIHDTDSIPCILGQIAGSCIPLADIRDYLANSYYLDYTQAGFCLVGIIPGVGDMVKATSKIGRFALKNADDIGIYAEILSFANKNFPDAVKQLGKNDEFVQATKKISLKKGDNITKKQYDETKEILGKIGLDDVVETSGSKTYTVDPSMQAKDIEMGVLIDGAYIKNPTAQNMSDLIKPGSNYVGNSKMNGQFMYVVDTNGNIVIGSRAGQHMPHPTLIGGTNPTVQGAGIVEIRGGKIYSIDNASGHFKPDSSCMISVQNAFGQLPLNVFHKDFQGYSTFGD